MKKTLFSSALICAVFSVFAHASSADNFFKGYVNRTWNQEDGIQGNTITDILQDNDGYILFGTYGGLTQFDGNKFTILNKFYNEKYDFFSARSLMQDSKGNTWVGSNDEGVHCIKTDGTVINFTIENGLPNNSIRSFCEDKSNNIWIGTSSGIACVSEEGKIVELPGFKKIPLENRFIVNQLYCDTAGRVWIVTNGESGLYKYEDEHFDKYTGISTVKNPDVTYMTQDSSDAYWFGISPCYAVRISGNDETLHNIGHGDQKGSAVNCIFQDSDKNIWFGMDTGLTIYHEGLYSYYDKDDGLADNTIIKIIEDTEKNIWIATDHGGIQKFSTSKFQTTEMPTIVNAMVQDTFRQVTWLAGNNGLYCYKNGKFIENEITDYCKNVRIRHVSLTKKGDLLVSCYEQFGQLKFNLDGTVQGWKKEQGLAGDRVRVAEEMSNGDIYVGTTSGLSIIDGKTGAISNITSSDILQNDYIMCLFEDKEGQVWVGTDGGGVFILKDMLIVKTITKEDKLAGNVIFKIVNLKEDEIWICTGTGASRVKNGELYTFDAANGFGSAGIFQLISDFSGRVWGTSNSGIFFVKHDDLEKVIAGKMSSVTPKYFSRLDGITSGGVTATSLAMKDNLGRIWFPLIDGFTVFDPVRNSTKEYAPRMKIEAAFIDTEKADISSGKIVMKPGAKRLKIDYTGISFVSSGQITFKTKLSGFDDDYSEWTSARECTYTNLSPGTYTFQVKAQTGDEVLSWDSVKLTVVKKPYLWQRPWFIILVIILVISIVVLIVYRKMNALKKDKEFTEKLSIEVIQALVGTIDAKDKYTKGHSKRVANYSVMLAKELGMNDEQRKEIYFSALLHDIGKIGIPDAIINKEGKLTAEEYETVKGHPEMGSKILSSISIMPTISVGARGHHERFDGKGYPDKKGGEEIPRIARIIGVADAYDAMTSNRSYRNIMKQSAVREQIEKNMGTQFDPEIAAKMLEIIDNDTEYDLREKENLY